MMKHRQYLVPIALFIVGIVASLLIGASNRFDYFIIKSFRIPRTLVAMAVGGGLSVSGALVQGLLSNPLADPFTMGTASAAALGAIVALVVFGVYAPLASSLAAFGFSLLHLWILATFFKKSLRDNPKEFILIGVISGFIFSSLATLVLALAKPEAWSYSMGWLLGSVKQSLISEAVAVLFATLVFTVLSWFHWKALDMISVHADLAFTSGVDISKLRLQIFIISALLTSICVSVAGIVGFVGLLVPHAVRALGVRSYRVLIPMSYLTGAGLLSLSDALARVAAKPSELPVGIVTALAGGPLFLYLSRKSK